MKTLHPSSIILHPLPSANPESQILNPSRPLAFRERVRVRAVRRSSFLIPHSSLGFTLVEMLIATTLSLLILGAVIQMFGSVSNSVTDSRALLETADRLRLAGARLQQDLTGVTVRVDQAPPRKPEENQGYFEYIEGPMGVQPVDTTNLAAAARPIPVNSDVADTADANLQPIDYHPLDSTIGDVDDILMFTTRSDTQSFVGKCAYPTQHAIRSDTAEVAWFVRGRTLHRRTLLVAPLTPGITQQSSAGYYARNDVSARINTGSPWVAGVNYPLWTVVTKPVPDGNFYYCIQAGTSGAAPPNWSNNPIVDNTVRWAKGCLMTPNTLGDLTKRENRFAHWKGFDLATAPYDARVDFPCDARRWYQLGLPTLLECSSPNWDISAIWGVGMPLNQVPPDANNPSVPVKKNAVDFWMNSTASVGTDTSATPWAESVVCTGGTRFADDVILTNVISFDVKAWDPTVTEWDAALGDWLNRPTYVDLGYNNLAFNSTNVRANTELGSGLRHLGHPRSGLAAATWEARVYDTYSSQYESDGVREAAVAHPGTAGIVDALVNALNDDATWFNNNYGITGNQLNDCVYDPGPLAATYPTAIPGYPLVDLLQFGENETAPPYPIGLRGIQVKIRVFDPDTRQIRELTIVQDFPPQ